MKQEDYRATLLIILGLAAANLTGLARQAVLAHQLGAGRAADVYLVAFALPEFAFIALPIVLAPAYLPLFARRRMEQGEKSAWRFGLRVAALLLAVLLAVSILASLAAPLYLNWLAPGFTDSQRHQALQATRLMLPAIVVHGLVALAATTLQVYRRFARPALAAAVYNATFCLVLLLLPLSWTAGRAAWGVLLGTVAALLLQAALLWKHRPRTLFTDDRLAQQDRPCGPDVRQMARATGWMAAGYAVHHAILLVDRAMATMQGAGRVASLQFAYHIALVAGQVSGLAVSTALFPRLAEQAAREDSAGIKKSLGDALRFVLLIGLPTTCALVLLRVPIVDILLKRGAFDAAAAATVSRPLLWYAVAVLADALCQPLWRLVYAHQRPWTVLIVNGIQTAVRLLCNIALIPAFGYTGLALSAAIGLLLQAGVLTWWTWRQVGPYLDRTWWNDAARIALATAVAVATAWAGTHKLAAASPMLILCAGGALGGLAYLLALKSFRLRIRWRAQAVPPH